MKQPKNKKKIIIISIISLLIIAALAVGAVLLAQKIAHDNSPEFTMSDKEFLVAHSPWHKFTPAADGAGELSDKLIWTFNADGTGTITTNGGIDTYKMTWKLTGSNLHITTDWLYDLEDDFSLTTNREESQFTVVDIKEDKITTFGHEDDTEQ